jgi:diguanylate cyclase (GGDEF)-like protein
MALSSRPALALPDLAMLQRLVLTGSLSQLAETVVAEAAGSGHDFLSCGLTLHQRPDGELLVASSDGRAQRLDSFQQSQQDGPCIRALATGHTVELADTNTEPRWPLFAERARQAGVTTTLSVPLGTDLGTVGALNLYRKEPWNETDRKRAHRFARHVASTVALAQQLAPLAEAKTAETSAEHVSQLREQITHDELTGLLNRRGLGDMLAELLNDGLREGVAVLFCDLDNFKRINDGLGHEAGDVLLRTLAERLRTGLPTGCVPARLSGDEFVILCPDVTAAGGLDVVTSRARQLLQVAMPLPHQGLVDISASIGAATVNTPETTAEDVFRYADAAMFTAKDNGPGSVSIADPALISTVDRQLGLESDLRQALSHDELVLHYQPIVNRTGTLLMVEALLRWPHPEHGMITPGTILSTAARGNLTTRLDQYVLRLATGEATAWTQLHPDPPAVAINLSTAPDDPHLSEALSRILDRTGLDRTRLVLEITETQLASLTEPAQNALRVLTDRGIRFALDDFGTGYSSLARLEALPVSILKLDKSFTTDLASNPVHHGISTAVLAMATSMGQTSVAEGIETPDQFHILAQLGYPAYQGFLLCPPVPAHELHSLIHTGTLPMP